MLSLYTDGSSSGRSNKPGGWGYVIVRDDTQVLLANAGGDKSTTNNLMEMEAAIEALEAVLRHNLHRGEAVELVSDSQYVLGLASGAYHPSKNMEQARRLRELTVEVKARTRWVRGHSGHIWNERADQLANYGKEKVKRHG